MNIPEISEDAIQEACLEPIDPGRIYDWLVEKQPALSVAADKIAATADPILSSHVMVGMALVLRALSYMPEEKPPSAPGRGVLQVGTTGKGEVVINHPGLITDAEGNGYIIFSPEQAKSLANTLLSKAKEAQREAPGRQK